jgi:hypothetical protein
MPRPYFDIDPHGRIAPQSEEARRALADRAGRFALLPTAADLFVALRSPPAGGSSPAPRCILAGDLSACPIGDLVAFVHQSKLSGVLTVGAAGVERSVAFREGEVRSAESEAPGERIGEVAVRLGYVTEDQLAEASSGTRPVGKVLVERGLVTAKDLWRCVQEQVTAVFHSILLAREGTFHVVDEPEGDRPATPLSVNTQTLLMDGIRRIDEMSLFRARIPAAHAWLRRREPRRPISLKPLEQSMLDLVDGHRRVSEIAREAHLSEFDATKILYHLAEAGYVEAASAPGTVPASPGDRLAAICDGMNGVLRQITAAAAARQGAESFLAGARAFLGDPSSRHAPLWKLVLPGPDGAVDRGSVLENLSSLGAAALQRIEASGDPGRFLFDGLRELVFFYLFQAGERMPGDEQDALAESVKPRLEALEALR